ncbi:ComEC/Rec2 family competence protein [Campylobacter sp. 9BO]|uniref:ComEC/Rec2 family competence protein n=1 Tax=Campylobacter sp. 9BO TaxID=3424759 RepID=UPI003D353918
MKLFYTWSERGWCYFILLMVFGVNLAYEFTRYHEFMSESEREILAKVVNVSEREKNGFKYAVLRLEYEKFIIFTTSRSLKFKQNDDISATIHTLDISFTDFLRQIFFAPTSDLQFVKNEEGKSLRAKILANIAAQHENIKITELYSALFMAAPISQELRDDVMRLGVSHLVAISGYHLGVIMAFFFVLLTPIFRFAYAKICPWRNYKFDIFLLAFCFCAIYFLLIGFVPSFLRAFFMALFGFFLLVRGVRVVDYEMLLLCVCVLVAVFLGLLFNIGFYLSVAGVFYIFLYCRYFGDKFGLLAHSFWLNLYLFCAMQVCVLYFFQILAPTQALAIPVSYIFSIFYPVSFILHVFGFGGLFDVWLEKFLNLTAATSHIKIELWQFLLYNVISLLAIKSRALMIFVGMIGAFIFVVF